MNWKPGDDVIITGAVSNEEAQKKYPGWLEDVETVPASRSTTEVE